MPKAADVLGWPRALAEGGVGVSLMRCALVATGVFALASVSLAAPREVGQLAAVWPANALVLALLLRADRASWGKTLIAGLLGNLAAQLVFGTPAVAARVLPLANTLEILICAQLMLRLTGPRTDLTRPAHLWAFVLSAGLAAPLASATLAASVLRFGHGEPFARSLVSWWATDALGLLIVTPALLALTPEAVRQLGRTVRTGRGALSIAALALSLALAFGLTRYPVLYLVPAALIFVAFELHLAGAALALLATWLLSTGLTLIGRRTAGMSHLTLTDSAEMLQLFLAVMSLTVLPVAAAVSSRQRIAEALARKQAETEAALIKLGESEARYRLLTDRTVDVIIRYDLDGMMEYVSPSVSKYGFRPEELIGRPVADLIHPESLENLAQRLARMRRGETFEGARTVFRSRHADGSWAWVEGKPASIRDGEGNVVGIVTVVRDITQWRAMEDELRRRTAEAEAASDAKSEFLANMSHEIRTPLTALVGFAGLLEGAPELSERSRAYVERIDRSGQALLAIVNDVLDFAKMEAGQVELAPAVIAPAQLIRDTLDLVADQASGKGLTLDLACDALPAHVLADGDRLRQVLLNLLVNAIKFTAEGGVGVRASYEAEAGRLRIAVTDTGEGVPEAQRDRVFQRFSQIDSSHSRRHGGTGLGLAICTHLVDLMGGELGLDSRAGAGSTFWFAVDAPTAEPAPAAEADDGSGLQGSLRSARVLVVDDVAANRELVRAMLEAVGHCVEEACDGAEAVEASGRARYDLVLMDMQMPRMDGLAATRAIRSDCPHNRTTPILALSANVLCSQVAACFEAGMDDHLAKPIAMVELLEKVAFWSDPDREGVIEPSCCGRALAG